jgi:N-acetylglucosaminyldiphosphoundecaprenol N-acetyl-beta-D-mannosaminyltransferase
VGSSGRSATQNGGRAAVLGCAIDRLDMDETLARCREIVERGGYGQQVSINAAKVVAMRRDARLREAVERCALVNADGQSVVWASRLLGDPLPERVAGIDLMQRLIALAEREGYGVYILGARRPVLEEAVRRLREAHPRLRIVGHRDGYFAEGEAAQVAAEVRDSGAQVLFVAISSPRKEHWLGEHGAALGVSLAMGVGGSIDVVAGAARRAPPPGPRHAHEWLYRVLQEPRRLSRRYLATNLRFAAMVAIALARRLRDTIGLRRPRTTPP